MKKEFFLMILIILVVSSLCGCISEGRGTLVLKITDARPELNITEALVTISNVEVHLIASGWHTVVKEPTTFNLILLQDAQEILGSANLSTGHYSQIRLNVDNAKVTIDGINYNLKIPSNKVQLISPFQIEDNKTTVLTLDFDVQESVHSTGDDKYIMRPTIKIIQE